MACEVYGIGLQSKAVFVSLDRMKASANFLELKNETAPIILSLQDEKILAKVRAILGETPLTQEDLDAIDRGLEDSRAGRVTPLDEYLK